MAELTHLGAYTGNATCVVDHDRSGVPMLLIRPGTSPVGIGFYADEVTSLLREILEAVDRLPRRCQTCAHGIDCGKCSGTCQQPGLTGWTPAVSPELLDLLDRLHPAGGKD